MSVRQFIQNFTLSTAFLANVFAADGSSLELVSRAHLSRPASFGDSGELEISADGKWAVFASSGNGIVTNDNNGLSLDVFVRNLETGETTLVSGDNTVPGGLSDGNSFGASISADGQLIVFESEASNLVENDNNGVSDAFLYHSTNGTLSLLSKNSSDLQFAAASGAAVLSADGRFVLLESHANGVSPLDSNNSVDLYRLELSSGAFEIVSARSNNLSPAGVAFPSAVIGNFDASISADGRFVAFISSGTNHTPGVPGNAPPQIYLRDMIAQTNAWLTRVTNGVAAGNVSSPVISSNGEVVVFLSSVLHTNSTTSFTPATTLHRFDVATGLVRRMTVTGTAVEQFALSENGNFLAFCASNQIWLEDLTSFDSIRVTSTANNQPASGISAEPSISADGRFVVFTSTATNLVAGQSGEFFQTYRFDRESGEITLLSASTSSGAEAGADHDTMFPAISGDGAVAGFMSYASNLTTNDNPLSYDVFIVSGTNSVALASAAHPLSIAASATGRSYVEANALSVEGRFVVFSSEAHDVVANDTNSARDIFLRDLQTGTTTLISTQPDGAAHSNAVTFVGASLDANTIAYYVNGTPRHVYVYQRSTGSNTLASILPSGAAVTTAGTVMLSPDGRYLIFRELGSISSPLYIRDLQAGVTAQHPAPGIVSFGTEPVVISPSGRYLLTRNQGSSAYALHDLTGPTHLTNLASAALPSQPFAADSLTLLLSVGADSLVGLRYFAGFGSNVEIATNSIPVALSPNGNIAAYLQRSGTNRHLFFYDASRNTSTPLMQDGTNVSITLRSSSAFSADSRYFAFVVTNALVPVAHSFNKLYVYDTVLKTVRLAGVNASGDPAEFGVSSPTFSANGRVLVFDTIAANLIPGDLNLSSDVFVNRFAPVDSDTDGLEDGWETIYFGGLTLNGDADSDNDGVSNRDEFLAGSDPNLASSMFAMQMEVEGETLHLRAPATPGFTYQLQYRADLSTGEWQNLGEPTVTLSGAVAFETAVDLDGNGFYRIVVVN